MPASAVHALPEPDQLEVGHRALHPEHKAIIRIAGIVDGALVDDERARQASHLEQAVPVGRGARQARGFQHEDCTDPAQAHGGGQPLKPIPVLRELARLPEIFGHELDLRRGPPQLACAIHQFELALGAGAVVENLRGARLPRIHEGTPLLVLSEDLGMTAHDLPPLRSADGGLSAPSTGPRLRVASGSATAEPRADALCTPALVLERVVSGYPPSVGDEAWANFSARASRNRICSSRRPASNKTSDEPMTGQRLAGRRSVQPIGSCRRIPSGSSTSTTSPTPRRRYGPRQT